VGPIDRCGVGPASHSRRCRVPGSDADPGHRASLYGLMATQPDELAPGSVERFWAWWAAARDRMAAAIDRQSFSKQIAREMTNAVGSMHASIGWELGPGRESPHALTLPFDGDLSV